MNVPDPALVEFLRNHGLAGRDETGGWIPLTGGVSSDIWRVETGVGTFCVKRALARLKVAADWTAPTQRNAMEWAFMEVASTIAPGAVPRPIAHDPDRHLFAMDWLSPDRHPVWKTELMAGRVDPALAGDVGALIGRIHSATARNPTLRARFATDDNFEVLRVEPYLRTTSRVHPDLATAIEDVVATTMSTHKALVHGDVSPKNVLCGPEGPVLLDAECAWFGDPAFDLAFCLNHLVIKARVVSGAAESLAAAFDRFASAYLVGIDWEPVGDLELRAARLLPALALARVDGKSPVEYLNHAQRNALRAAARDAVASQPTTLDEARALLSVR